LKDFQPRKEARTEFPQLLKEVYDPLHDLFYHDKASLWLFVRC
jgi:hypothetical protein